MESSKKITKGFIQDFISDSTQAALVLKANDIDVLHNAGNEVKSGNLTLLNDLILPNIVHDVSTNVFNIGISTITNRLVTIPTEESSAGDIKIAVTNKTGFTISKGSAVYINGAQGSKATIALALADPNISTSTAVGIVTEDILDNTSGYVVIVGEITNLDTSSFINGDRVFLSPTVPGGLTTVVPSSPNNVVFIGTVTNSHATQGKIIVNVIYTSKLDRLVDVAITSPLNNDLLSYETSSGLWKNKSITSIGGIEGIGTTNYIPKWSSTSGLTNSQIIDNGARILVGTTTDNLSDKLQINGNTLVKGSSTTTGNALNITDSAGTQLIGFGNNKTFFVPKQTIFVFDRTGDNNAANSPRFRFQGLNITTQDLYAEQNNIVFTSGINIGGTVGASLSNGPLSFNNQRGSQSSLLLTAGNGARCGLFMVGGNLASLAFSTDFLERLRITTTGNVLIGTTTDNGVDKLQVSGSIQALSATITNLSKGLKILNSANNPKLEVSGGNHTDFFRDTNSDLNTQDGIFIHGATTSIGSNSSNRGLITFVNWANNLHSGIQAGTINSSNIRAGLYFINGTATRISANATNTGLNTTMTAMASSSDLNTTMVNVGTEVATNATKFNVTSSTLGSSPFPRMTSAQRVAIVTPIEGLYVHQTDAPIGLYQYTSGAWKLVNGDITGTGTTDFLSKWSSTTGLTNSQIFDNGTNVLVNTITDDGIHKLQVNGSSVFKGELIIDNGVDGRFSFTNTTSNDFQSTTTGFGAYKKLRVIASEIGFNTGASPTEKMVIVPNGNVLIGTAIDNGIDKLQVNGTISSSAGITLGTTLFNENRLKLSTSIHSTGLATWGANGILATGASTFNVDPATGFIISSSNPTGILPIAVNYLGGTGLTTPYLATDPATYVLVNSSSNLVLQNTKPTVTQRRDNIFLGVIGHPNGVITGVGNSPDLIANAMSQVRDMFEPTRLINEGIVAYNNSNDLTLANTAGILYGFGIGFITNGSGAPSILNIAPGAPTTFQYRTQTGVATGNLTSIVPGSYDLGGVVTAIPGSSNQATNQRIYLLQNGMIRIQQGQTIYPTLTDAISAASNEPFVVFSNNKLLGILIGILAVQKGATDLSNTAQARFLPVSKFGETVGAAAGIAIGTLQTAYNNSVLPQIGVTDVLGALTVDNERASDASIIFQGRNIANTVTFSLTGSGDVRAKSIEVINGTVRLSGYTVGTLPLGVQGDTAFVTDALAPTYLGIAVGGGSTVCKVFFNGTNWIT